MRDPLRFEQMREALGLSKGDMAEKLAITRDTWRRYIDGALPTGDVMARIVDLGFSLDWLLNGAGSMRPDDTASNAHGAETSPRGNASVWLSRADASMAAEGFVLLPRYDVKAAAGAGALIHSEQIVDFLAFRADWVRDRLGRRPEDLLLIEASGDSMQPTIHHGDLLLVDRSVEQLRDSAIYVIANFGELMVKRIERRVAGGVVIRSDNNRYDPETLSADEASSIRIIGQVVWHGGLL